MICTFHNYFSDRDFGVLGFSPQDIYQTYEYTRQESERSGGQPCYFLFRSPELQAVLPLIQHPIENLQAQPTGMYDAKSVYGYPGILFSKPPDDGDADKIFESLLPVLAENKLLTVFIRMHPYFNTYSLTETPSVKMVTHGEVVYVHLQEGYKHIASGYSYSHKRDLRTLYKSNYYAKINAWEDYELFQEAYLETMQHVNASQNYFFDESYFQSLFSRLKEHITLISVYSPQHIFSSAALYFTFNNIVHYHLGGTFTAFRKFAPSKLVFDTAIQYFSEQGFHILNLGGGVGSADDALFRFKKGFSAHTKQFSTIRCISDLEMYHTFVRSKFENAQVGQSDFFPLYRL